jgi:hypothetical protein
MSDRSEANPQTVAVVPHDDGTRHRFLRRCLLAMIGLLYLISVPWYRATDAPLQIVFGLPDWVAVAIGCYVAVAVLNAIAWLLTTIPDPPSAIEPVSDPLSDQLAGTAVGTAIDDSHRGTS